MMKGTGLIEVFYRPEEQRDTLAGGPGQTEMLVPATVLNDARRRALDLSTRCNSIHQFFEQRPDGVIEKEAIILHGDVIIVIPTVDNMVETPLDTYASRGWPGLSLQSDDYFSLRRVAEILGNLPVPAEDCEYLRSEGW